MSRDAGDPGRPRRPRRPSEPTGPESTWHPRQEPEARPSRPGGRAEGRAEPTVERTGHRVLFRTVGAGTLAAFCRQLAAYLDSGVDLIKALRGLETQFAGTGLAPVLGRVGLAVRRGEPLAEAMAREPRAFDPLFLSMMKVAEARGGVPETLRRLAEHYEARLRLIRQARSAMIYPVVVLVIAFGVVMLLALFVLPVFASLLTDLGRQGGELPLPTRALMAFSRFVQAAGWWLLPLAAIGTPLALMWAYRTPAGRRLGDELAVRVPVLGLLLRKIDTARFARTLSILLDGGLDLGTSLDLTADVVHLVPLRRALRRSRAAVVEGSELSAALGATRRFGPDVIAIVESGEETGQLPESLDRLADEYEDQAAYMVKNLGHLIQPLIYIVLGGLVLFIILAVILPYIAMITSLTR